MNYHGNFLLQHNVAVASFNYHLAPELRYSTQNQDVVCAIKAIAEQITAVSISPKNITLLGDSAGRLLASTYALTEQEPDIAIRGVVSFYGTTDLIYQLNRTTHRNANTQNHLGSADEKNCSSS